MSLDRTALTLALSAVAMSWGEEVALPLENIKFAPDAVYKLYRKTDVTGAYASFRARSGNPPTIDPEDRDDKLFLGLQPTSGGALGAYADVENGVLKVEPLGPMPSGATLGAAFSGRIAVTGDLESAVGYSDDQNQAEVGPLWWGAPNSPLDPATKVVVGSIWKGRMLAVNKHDWAAGHYVDGSSRSRPLVRKPDGALVEPPVLALGLGTDRGEVWALNDDQQLLLAAGWVGTATRRYAAVWAWQGSSFSDPIVASEHGETLGRNAVALSVAGQGSANWVVYGQAEASEASPRQPFMAYTRRETEPPGTLLLERSGLALDALDVDLPGDPGRDAVIAVTGPDSLPFLLIQPSSAPNEPIQRGVASDLNAWLEPGTPAPGPSTRVTGLVPDAAAAFGGVDFPASQSEPFAQVWLARNELKWRLSSHIATSIVVGQGTGSPLDGASLDGRYYPVAQGIVANPSAPRVRVEVLPEFGVSYYPGLQNLTFRVTSRISDSGNFVLRLSLWDWTANAGAGAWVDGTQTLALKSHMRTFDWTVTGGDTAKFVKLVNGSYQAKGRYTVTSAPSPVVPPPVTLEVEQARFLHNSGGL